MVKGCPLLAINVVLLSTFPLSPDSTVVMFKKKAQVGAPPWLTSGGMTDFMVVTDQESFSSSLI